ncbi:MAG: phosphoadenosine phosphosulfate reductase domain-containing protein [Candidatus Odinarchaeia archaeon]
MPSIYLGPLLLKWCKNCNLPILEKNRCDICKNKTIKVNISPPGDIRPALKEEILRIRSVLDKQYGSGIGEEIIPDNKIVILNKVSADESSDEVILDGEILGLLVFNPIKLEWSFTPKLEGARRILNLIKTKYVKVDKGAEKHIIKGANVLAPGIIEYDANLRRKEYAFILNEKDQLIGVGICKFNGADISSVKKGMVIKTKKTSEPKPPQILPGGQNWEDVIKANEDILIHKANKAKKVIREITKKYKLPVLVSFSGGKDSLCTLVLVKEALKNGFKVLFIDTGIEFEETISHVQEIIKKFNLESDFIYKRTKGDFWEGLKDFGPPARDFRYCCKTLKLSAATEAISENFHQTIINFTGQRRYESIPRSLERIIWKNPYVPNQINVSPIRDWTHLHVWLYLKMKKIPINKLYDLGYQRIGCMYCPATKLSELETMRKVHPDKYRKWIDYLISWAEKHQLSEKWVYYGFWRWKKPGVKQENLAAVLKIKLKPELKVNNSEELKFSITAGISPCKDGGYVVEGKFNKKLELKDIAEALKILGDVKASDKLGFIHLKAKGYTATIFTEGSVKINLQDKTFEKEVIEKVVKSIIRVIKCTNCKICIEVCPYNAIKITNGKLKIDKSKCDGCLKCIESCPAVNYTYPYN